MDHSTRVEAGVGFGIEMALKIVPLICKGIDSAQAKARHRKFNALWEKAQTPGMFTEEDMKKARKLYPKVKTDAQQKRDKIMLQGLNNDLAYMKESLAANKAADEAAAAAAKKAEEEAARKAEEAAVAKKADEEVAAKKADAEAAAKRADEEKEKHETVETEEES